MVPLVVSLLAAPVVLLAGTLDSRLAGPSGVVAAGLSFAAVLWGVLSGGGTVDLPWSDTWDLRLAFELDGLGAMYALLATGVGFAIVCYTTGYLPAHLDHQGRPREETTRFYALILLFMGAMVGLVTSKDLLMLFVFWDLTAITSYFLISYDVHEEESRRSALMALLVTGITAVLLLVGVMMLYVRYGTFSLDTILSEASPGTYLTVAAALMCVAGLAKSAQVPFHFWLPRAMAAPTPVSAYLHSAAMVAAGVFLIGRVYPLVSTSQLLLDCLVVVGFLSMLTGGILALTRDVLKQLLAYSTISQYGYVVFMFGLGGTYGVAGASFYVIAHALAKSALFMTAGAVTEASDGETRLSQLGGFARTKPALAVGSAMAAASLAALPLTLGFFKDELFFDAALDRGWPFAAMALVGTVLTVAYAWKFWSGAFLGEPVRERCDLPNTMVVPVVVLGAVSVAGGMFVAPFASLAEAAGSVSFGTAVTVEPAYHLDLRPSNVLAAGTFVLALLFLVARRVWEPAAGGVAELGRRYGPESLYTGLLGSLNSFSDRIHSLEVDTLRSRIAAVLIPMGGLIGASLLVSDPVESGAYGFGVVERSDVPLIAALFLAASAAVAATFARKHLTLVLVLSGCGFSLAAVYAFFGGPDVALVAVLVETIMTLLLLGILALIPSAVLRISASRSSTKVRMQRSFVFGGLSGLFAFVVAWGTLSQTSPERTVADEHIRLAPEAHASDIVTVILADFRGLDTLGEITVLGIALVGISALLTRGRLW